MDSETKQAITKAAIKRQPFLVEVKLGGKVTGTVTVQAYDKEHAKEQAFVALRFNVKKDYDTQTNKDT